MPDQLGDSPFDFVVLEPPEVDGKEVGQGLDVGGFECVY